MSAEPPAPIHRPDEVTDTRTPHVIRITSGGKLRSWVDFALKFFKEQPGRPLTLQSMRRTSHADILQPEGSPPSDTPSSSALIIPRLISAAEIIKREYLKGLEPQPLAVGLHQYNYLNHFEEETHTQSNGVSLDAEATRSLAIIAALEGHKHVKMRRIPYMKITLCTVPLSELEDTHTYQPPSAKRMSKSAKTRWKKRETKKKRVVESNLPASI